MVSLIFLIIDIEVLVIPSYISSYFITSGLYIRPSNANIRNNKPIQNNNNNNNENSNDNNNISNDNNINNNNNNNNNKSNSNNNNNFNNNISKYYRKIRKNDILGMLLPPKMFYATHSKKGCYKIMTDHK